jgi:hypothetical protein
MSFRILVLSFATFITGFSAFAHQVCVFRDTGGREKIVNVRTGCYGECDDATKMETIAVHFEPARPDETEIYGFVLADSRPRSTVRANYMDYEVSSTVGNEVRTLYFREYTDRSEYRLVVQRLTVDERMTGDPRSEWEDISTKGGCTIDFPGLDLPTEASNIE